MVHQFPNLSVLWTVFLFLFSVPSDLHSCVPDDEPSLEGRHLKRCKGLDGAPIIAETIEFPPITTIQSIIAVLDSARFLKIKMGVEPSQILVCLDLDDFAVWPGTSDPREGEKTRTAVKSLVDEGFRVLFLTARNYGLKHDLQKKSHEIPGSGAEPDTLPGLVLMAREIKANIADVSNTFPEIPTERYLEPFGRSTILQHWNPELPDFARPPKEKAVQEIQEFVLKVLGIDIDNRTFLKPYRAYYVDGILFAGIHKADALRMFLKRNPMPLTALIMGDDRLDYLRRFHEVDSLKGRFGPHIYLLHMPTVEDGTQA